MGAWGVWMLMPRHRSQRQAAAAEEDDAGWPWVPEPPEARTPQRRSAMELVPRDAFRRRVCVAPLGMPPEERGAALPRACAGRRCGGGGCCRIKALLPRHPPLLPHTWSHSCTSRRARVSRRGGTPRAAAAQLSSSTKVHPPIPFLSTRVLTAGAPPPPPPPPAAARRVRFR